MKKLSTTCGQNCAKFSQGQQHLVFLNRMGFSGSKKALIFIDFLLKNMYNDRACVYDWNSDHTASGRRFVFEDRFWKLNKKGRCSSYENDLSAEEETEKQRARLQKENEYKERKKRSEEKKSKRKKEVISIRAAYVVFLLFNKGNLNA